MKQRFADDGTEDCVAKKLEPLVRIESVTGARSVGQCRSQEFTILERITDLLLAEIELVSPFTYG